jgi:hypothetical protein
MEMSKFNDESEFLNFLTEARDPMDKNCLASRFLYHRRVDPHVYSLFEAFAKEVAAKKKKASAWLIANRMRWEVQIEIFDNEAEYKINNDFISLYARLFMARHPKYNKLFTVKKLERIFGL